MWGSSSEIGVDDLVVFCVLVRLQVVRELLRILGVVPMLCGIEVVGHAPVKREHARCRANLRAHAADCRLTRTAQALHAQAHVLPDCARPALHGQDPDHLQVTY